MTIQVGVWGRHCFIAFALAAGCFGTRCIAEAIEPIDPRLASLQLDQGVSITQTEAHAPAAFGEAGAWWWSVGGGFAGGAPSATLHSNLNFGLHTFIVDTFELGLEFGGWYFNQDEQDDAFGGNFNLRFRWHFVHRERMSVFVEGGAGVLLASDEVPDMGSEFNFTPHAGLGLTWRLGDGPARLVVGGRWLHISNARTAGTARNPGTDNGMAYVEVIWPF